MDGNCKEYLIPNVDRTLHILGDFLGNYSVTFLDIFLKIYGIEHLLYIAFEK